MNPHEMSARVLGRRLLAMALLCGACLGVIAGLSESPIGPIALQSVSALVGAFAGYMFVAQTTSDRPVSNSPVENQSVAPLATSVAPSTSIAHADFTPTVGVGPELTPTSANRAHVLYFLTAMLFGSILGAGLGIWIRNKEFLVPAPPPMVVIGCEPWWPVDACTHAILQDILMDGLDVPEESQHRWRLSVESCIEKSRPQSSPLMTEADVAQDTIKQCVWEKSSNTSSMMNVLHAVKSDPSSVPSPGLKSSK